jgi:hypothetical protein
MFSMSSFAMEASLGASKGKHPNDESILTLVDMNEAAAAAWFMCIWIVRSFQAWILRILAHTLKNQQECLE